MDELDELIEDFEWRASLEKELAKSAFARDSFDFAEKHERNETKYNRVAELLKELKEYKIKDGKTESEDCISREETLNKINGLIAEYIPLMPTGWTLPLNIAKTINELPSVTPQQTSWIPVSERSPKIGQRILVTYNQEDEVKIDITNYTKHGFLLSVVKAWMPLPQSYKAEKEENVCKDCYYNDGEVHAECVICGKAESEVNTDDNN